MKGNHASLENSKRRAFGPLLWLCGLLAVGLFGLFGVISFLSHRQQKRVKARLHQYEAMLLSGKAAWAEDSEAMEATGSAKSNADSKGAFAAGPRVQDLPFVGKHLWERSDPATAGVWDALNDLFTSSANPCWREKDLCYDFMAMAIRLKLVDPNAVPPVSPEAAAMAVQAYLRGQFGALLEGFSRDLRVPNWQWPPEGLGLDMGRWVRMERLLQLMVASSLASGESMQAGDLFSDLVSSRGHLEVQHFYLKSVVEHFISHALLQPGWSAEQRAAFLKDPELLQPNLKAMFSHLEELKSRVAYQKQNLAEVKRRDAEARAQNNKAKQGVGVGLASVFQDVRLALTEDQMYKSRFSLAQTSLELLQSQIRPDGSFVLNAAIPVDHRSEVVPEESWLDKMVGTHPLDQTPVYLSLHQQQIVSAATYDDYRELALLKLALEQYKAQTGAFPEELASVAGQFPNGEIPKTSFKDAPFDYQRVDQGFVLKSISSNALRGLPYEIPVEVHGR